MPVKSKKPWKYYEELINWDKVAEAIIGPDKEFLNEAMFKKIKARVYSAAAYFIPCDMDWFSFSFTEARYEITHNSLQRKPDIQIIDLEATVLETTVKPYKDFVGQKILFDWKSTSSNLDHSWKEKCYDSWQWRRYSANREAKLFEYRGLNWNDDIAISVIQVPGNIKEQVAAFMSGLVVLKNATVDSALDIYPMNQPRACNSFGQECEYKYDCENFTMPRACLLDRSYSYSSDDKFLLCPERYRRDNLKPQSNIPVSDAAFLGTCVHRGLEEIYKQLIAIQKG